MHMAPERRGSVATGLKEDGEDLRGVAATTSERRRCRGYSEMAMATRGEECWRWERGRKEHWPDLCGARGRLVERSGAAGGEEWRSAGSAREEEAWPWRRMGSAVEKKGLGLAAMRTASERRDGGWQIWRCVDLGKMRGGSDVWGAALEERKSRSREDERAQWRGTVKDGKNEGHCAAIGFWNSFE